MTTASCSDYRKAALEFSGAWTSSEIQHWRQRLDELWSAMTDEQRLREPWIHKDHYQDLRDRGLVPPAKVESKP